MTPRDRILAMLWGLSIACLLAALVLGWLSGGVGSR